MPFKYTHSRILIFAKEPIQGQVKSRLYNSIGQSRALALHCAMIQAVTETVKHSKLAPFELWVTANPSHPVFLSACEPKDIYLQRGADLGDRMGFAVQTTLNQEPCQSVIIIGADCPSVDGEYIEEALAFLSQGGEAVIGAAEDGGYVLMGLSKTMPSLFCDMPWGSDKVLNLTIERLEKVTKRGRYKVLEPRWDVDRPADLPRLSTLPMTIDY